MTPGSIDAHQHFWALARGDYGWLTPDLRPLYRDHGPDDLTPLLDACGVERTILVQAAPTEDETRFLVSLARDEPRVAGVVGWVDFEAPDAPARIETLATTPRVVGVRPMIQDLPDVGWMLSPRVAPAFDALEACGLPFDALVKPPHLENLLALLERHPRLRCVVDHAGKPAIGGGDLRAWSDAIARIAAETDAWCKLSGLVTECAGDASTDVLRPVADHLLASFGPDRLLWGSDWPVVLLRASYGEWREITLDLLAGLDDASRAAVLGGNAARFYRLDV